MGKQRLREGKSLAPNNDVINKQAWKYKDFITTANIGSGFQDVQHSAIQAMSTLGNLKPGLINTVVKTPETTTFVYKMAPTGIKTNSLEQVLALELVSNFPMKQVFIRKFSLVETKMFCRNVLVLMNFHQACLVGCRGAWVSQVCSSGAALPCRAGSLERHGWKRGS